jgi:3-oxoacyl-[acyl-carrier protein] reductase
MGEKRVVLVTGSTRGVGRRIAERFAEAGAAVALNYQSQHETAREALASVQELSPSSRLYQADVSSAPAAEGLIRSVIDDFGRIDLLVNNAGPMLVKPLAETSPDEWAWMLASNLSSVFFCCRFVLPFMRERKRGQIVNMGCLHGEIAPGGLPNSPAYGIAKTGVLMLTRMLARSEAKYNIRVNAVNPGLIETDDYQHYSEEVRAQWRKRVPQKRFGTPDEIADAVLFLTSDRAAYISGAVLPVHGGLWVPE